MALPQTIDNTSTWQPMKMGHGPPLRASNGDHYVVLQRIDNPVDEYMVYKADNGDATWSQQDAANRPGLSFGQNHRGGAYVLDGTTIHIIVYHETANLNVYYHSFSTSSDTWTTTDQSVFSDSNQCNLRPQSCGIAVRSDGDIVAVHPGAIENVSGTNYDRLDYHIHQGTGWTDASGSIDDGGAVDYVRVQCVLGASDKTHIVYEDNTNGDVYHKSLSSANSLSSAEEVSDSANAEYPQHPVYLDSAGDEIIMTSWLVSNSLYTSKITNDGTPAAEDTGAFAQDVETQGPFTGPSVTVASFDEDNEFHALSAHFSQNDLYYNEDTGSGWGTQSEEIDAVTVTNKMYASAIQLDDNSWVLAYVYVESGNTLYNEKTIKVGGTTYNQSAAGTLTTAGAIAKEAQKPVAGTVTPDGAVVKSTIKSAFAGTITPDGAVTKETQKAFAGTLTTSGALNTTKLAFQAAAGTLTTAGALVKQALKAFAGTVTPAGALTKQAQKPLGGALTTSGDVAKATSKTFAGSITPSGALVAIKTALQSVAGTLTTAGALTLQTGKAVAGTLTTAGAIVKETGKTFAGTLTTAGGLVRETQKALGGSITPSGSLAAIKTALQSVAGTLTTAGSITKDTLKAVAGTLTTSGALVRDTQKAVAGSVGPTGALATQFISGGGGNNYTQAVAGVLSMSGALDTSHMIGVTGAGWPRGRASFGRRDQHVTANGASESRVVSYNKVKRG